MIYTSYYGNYRKIPQGAIVLSVSVTKPSWVDCFEIDALKLNPSVLWKYKKDGDWEYYEKAYNEQLSRLDPREVLGRFIDLDPLIVLMCWEKDNTNCHRRLIRQWLQSWLYSCEEL